MKIATYNVNNINKRFAPLAAWLKKARPEVVCLQELKCEQHAFPADALCKLGYSSVWKGQRSWNGVAILSRGPAPVLTADALPGDDADPQSRYIEAAVKGVLIACIYLPNGNPQPGPKFDYDGCGGRPMRATMRPLGSNSKIWHEGHGSQAVITPAPSSRSC